MKISLNFIYQLVCNSDFPVQVSAQLLLVKAGVLVLYLYSLLALATELDEKDKIISEITEAE